jgi:hypothetical protein
LNAHVRRCGGVSAVTALIPSVAGMRGAGGWMRGATVLVLLQILGWILILLLASCAAGENDKEAGTAAAAAAADGDGDGVAAAGNPQPRSGSVTGDVRVDEVAEGGEPSQAGPYPVAQAYQSELGFRGS